jgi:CheY-like chemotaxis protein
LTNSTKQRTPRVLLVDDDETIPIVLAHFAEKFGVHLQFVHASDIQQGIDRLNESCFDAAVIDVILPGVTGVQLGSLVREQDPHIPLAYLTNLDTKAVRDQASKHHAWFLFKHAFIEQPGEDGIKTLLLLINRLAHLNPCLLGGIRIDKQGFQRKLARTPIQMPDQFLQLLSHSKQITHAA